MEITRGGVLQANCRNRALCKIVPAKAAKWTKGNILGAVKFKSQLLERVGRFPLTPTLSLGEREKRFRLIGRTTAVCCSMDIKFAEQRRQLFLLPEGEGQDEGNAAERQRRRRTAKAIQNYSHTFLQITSAFATLLRNPLVATPPHRDPARPETIKKLRPSIRPPAGRFGRCWKGS